MPSFTTIGSIQSTAALANSVALPVVEPSPKSGASLYPQLSNDAVAGVLSQLNHQPVIQISNQGEEVMQEVGPKESYPQSSGGSQSSSQPAVSPECEEGAMAYAGAAAGQLMGSEFGPAGEHVGGELGKAVGGVGCEITDAIASTFNTGPDNLYDPTNYGNGGTCTDPGPTSGQSAGKTGGYSIGGEDKGGGSSSMGSYIDPDTGESITNKDGKTIAGDSNAPSGTYIGEVDDPDFVNGETGPGSSSGSNGSSSGTNTDNSSQSTEAPSVPDETERPESTDHPDPNPNPSGSLPADDGSGSDGPINPRADALNSSESQALPVDDGSGGGTPFTIGANLPQLGSVANLTAITLSRTQIT